MQIILILNFFPHSKYNLYVHYIQLITYKYRTFHGYAYTINKLYRIENIWVIAAGAAHRRK